MRRGKEQRDGNNFKSEERNLLLNMGTKIIEKVAPTFTDMQNMEKNFEINDVWKKTTKQIMNDEIR